MGLEPQFGGATDPPRLPGLLLVPDRDHKQSIPVVSTGRDLSRPTKKVGWTMGLEPHFGGLPYPGRLPGSLLVTDRDYK